MLLLQHADVSLFLLEYDDISLLWRHCELVEHRIFSKKGALTMKVKLKCSANMVPVLQGLVYCCELVKMIHKNCG